MTAQRHLVQARDNLMNRRLDCKDKAEQLQHELEDLRARLAQEVKEMAAFDGAIFAMNKLIEGESRG